MARESDPPIGEIPIRLVIGASPGFGLVRNVTGGAHAPFFLCKVRRSFHEGRFGIFLPAALNKASRAHDENDLPFLWAASRKMSSSSSDTEIDTD